MSCSKRMSVRVIYLICGVASRARSACQSHHAPCSCHLDRSRDALPVFVHAACLGARTGALQLRFGGTALDGGSEGNSGAKIGKKGCGSGVLHSPRAQAEPKNKQPACIELRRLRTMPPSKARLLSPPWISLPSGPWGWSEDFFYD